MLADDLTFARDGAERFAARAASILDQLELVFRAVSPDKPGVRLTGHPQVAALLHYDGDIGGLAAAILGAECRPVRTTAFDKTANSNWSLGWHQDRTIAVAERIDVPGFGPWTRKGGLVHVEPPFAILAAMITLRVHLDRVAASNAPLKIAPGSHRLGRVRRHELADMVGRCGEVECLADAGDVWVYATPILHSSKAATEPQHRRVLQIDYAVGELPGGLRWAAS